MTGLGPPMFGIGTCSASILRCLSVLPVSSSGGAFIVAQAASHDRHTSGFICSSVGHDRLLLCMQTRCKFIKNGPKLLERRMSPRHDQKIDGVAYDSGHIAIRVQPTLDFTTSRSCFDHETLLLTFCVYPSRFPERMLL